MDTATLLKHVAPMLLIVQSKQVAQTATLQNRLHANGYTRGTPGRMMQLTSWTDMALVVIPGTKIYEILVRGESGFGGWAPENVYHLPQDNARLEQQLGLLPQRETQAQQPLAAGAHLRELHTLVSQVLDQANALKPEHFQQAKLRQAGLDLQLALSAAAGTVALCLIAADTQ